MNKMTLPLTLGLMILVTSCSLNRLVVNAAGDFMESGIDVIYSEGDLEIAEQFLANNLKMIELLLQRDPDNSELNLLAAQGFGAFAMAFVEDKNPQRAARLYERGLNYAFRALPEKRRFSPDITPQDLEILLSKYTTDDVPALFWLGYNWGSLVLQNLDNPRMLLNLSKVEMIMKRVLELDESYNFAGVHLFYGTFYAARPPLLGGNPEKGREHFMRNLELTGHRFYMTKFFLARYYAVQVQDRQLFDNLLQEILELDIDQYPEIRLMNALAQKKAQALLEKQDQYW
ncbi:MAG: TRAP transporter TatT component family protein [Fidelibacterota bacterium]